MTNTHDFDGKLILDNICNKYTIEEKKSLSLQLLDMLTDNQSKRYLSIIIKDIGTEANIDHTNSTEDYTLSADDLLPLCWCKRNNRDFILLLEEQLKDMATGFCPQGRTHRLYQLIKAFD